jgi:hypothetical protein
MFGSSLGIIASSGGPSAPTAPVSGYKAWYDASDTATITVSGSNVTQWNDKSANAFHLVQATSTKQPLSGTRTQNGKNMIDYDGNDDVLASNAATSAWKFLTDATGSSVFMVMFCDTTSNGAYLTDLSNAAVANQASYTWAKNPDDTGFFGKGTNNPSGYNWFTGSTSISFTDNTAQQWSLISNPTAATADRMLIYRNGTANTNLNAQTATSSTSNPATPLNLGGSGAVAESFNGGLCEVIIYDSVLSSTDREANQDYLAAKWGL